MNTLGAAVWTAMFVGFYFSDMMAQIKETRKQGKWRVTILLHIN